MIQKRQISTLIRSPERLNITFFIHSHIRSLKTRKVFDVILIPFGILKWFSLNLLPIKSGSFKYNLSIVCIIKNEAPYIAEWIKYNLSIGVDHFYIYDNESTDNLIEILEDFKKYITYTKIRGQLRQLDAYNNALNRFSRETKYLAVIDADEFLYCPKGDHSLFPIVNEYLKRPRIGGLVANWVVYGSSHFKTKPQGLVTDNFLYRSHLNFKKNRFIKTICNPRKVFSFTISHAANYLPGFYAVNEGYERVDWAESGGVSVSRIRINHYYSKSKEEFIKKRARGSGEVLAPRRMSEFDEHDKNEVFDESLKIYNKVHGLS